MMMGEEDGSNIPNINCSFGNPARRPIARINDISAAVASAVEEQDATTREMAQNVHQVAHSTSVVSEKVSGLAHAAGETGQSAEMVRDHAGELARQAESLRGQVDRFLSRIRAA